MKIKDEISQNLEDKNGNKIMVMKSGNVFLHLNQQKRRRIGRIDRTKRIFMCERNRGKHLFRKMNAYGFNEYLISKAKSFDRVLLSDDFAEYLIPISDISLHGRNYLHFQKQGFELQLFIPLEILEKYRKTQKTDLV